VERVEVSRFTTEQNISLNSRTNFLLEFNNIGNQPLTPKGTIFIYDKNDREIEALDFNSAQQSVLAGEKQSFNTSWNSGKRLGKFKAKLEADYGLNGDRNLQDLIYFWVLPKWFLIFFITVVLILIICLLILISKFKRQNRLLYHNKQREGSVIINLKGR
jgi:hypothetical protein